MNGTEARLWKVLSGAANANGYEDSFTRVESSTVDGISDVEYVIKGKPWHGWIELKTVNMPLMRRPFSLHTPFTLAQMAWLIRHDDHAHYLRSWLMLGVIGARTWKYFVLVPAKLSIYFVNVRKGTPHEILLSMPGVLITNDIKEVLTTICQG